MQNHTYHIKSVGINQNQSRQIKTNQNQSNHFELTKTIKVNQNQSELIRIIPKINTFCSRNFIQILVILNFILIIQFLIEQKVLNQIIKGNMVKRQKNSQFKNGDGRSNDPDYLMEKIQNKQSKAIKKVNQGRQERKSKEKIGKKQEDQTDVVKSKIKHLQSSDRQTRQTTGNVISYLIYQDHQPALDEQVHTNSHRQSNQSNSSQSPQNQNSQIQDSQDGDNEQIEDIRMIFVQFFNNIAQPNGLVFKEDFRKRLNKQFEGKIKFKFTPKNQLDPQGEEIPKIKKQVLKLSIFHKKYHNVKMDERQFKQYIQEDIKKMVNCFKQASYIFAKQVTFQLYNILRKLCNIVLQFRQKSNLENIEQSPEFIAGLRKFGDKIAIADKDDKDNLYFFFGYQFICFPPGLTQTQIQTRIKKQKYALKTKYRIPNTQFANFAQKTGLYLLKQMKQLRSYKTLN